MKIIDRMYEEKDVQVLKQRILEKAHFRNLADAQDKRNQHRDNHCRSKSRDNKKENLSQTTQFHKRANSKNGQISHRSAVTQESHVYFTDLLRCIQEF
jgi:hypothetical protein